MRVKQASKAVKKASKLVAKAYREDVESRVSKADFEAKIITKQLCKAEHQMLNHRQQGRLAELQAEMVESIAECREREYRLCGDSNHFNDLVLGYSYKVDSYATQVVSRYTKEELRKHMKMARLSAKKERDQQRLLHQEYMVRSVQNTIPSSRK